MTESNEKTGNTRFVPQKYAARTNCPAHPCAKKGKSGGFLMAWAEKNGQLLYACENTPGRHLLRGILTPEETELVKEFLIRRRNVEEVSVVDEGIEIVTVS